MDVKRVEHREHSGGVMRAALGQVCDTEASGELLPLLVEISFSCATLRMSLITFPI